MDFNWRYIAYIVMALFGVRLLISAGSSIIPVIKQSFMENDVMKEGVGVNADIVARSQTDKFDANLPVYRLTFKFSIPEGRQIESSLNLPLNAEEVMRYAPGNGISLKYDPKDPKRIALYDKPLILGD
ncbi:DUF3592 domain-containing protein [Kosakonia sp. H02]|nr:DUF3592 domain-containing protein [Kosakonia sp. H02]